VNSAEHRAIGDAATGGAMVNVGGESPEEAFWLTHGDVVALSGDYFRPGTGAGGLVTLARVAGRSGTLVGTRDELVAALKVASVDEESGDARFDPGGEFGHFDFSPRADRSDVERAVRDRYLAQAAVNDDHFVAPGRSDVATGSGFPSAPAAYRRLHEAAIDEAWELGRRRGDLSRAMAREAAAQHYLTDAFAAGHLRTPVAEIRRYWKGRHPGFWEALQHRVAHNTARALRDLSAALRVLPAGYVHDRTMSELKSRTGAYPELSAGDLVARCLHDWDNAHGLHVEGVGQVFGDGHIGEGVTTELALAAVRAGNDDVEAAYELAAAGSTVAGEGRHAAVREATGAEGPAFLAETKIPVPSDANPPQNWQAADVETLWHTPIVGATGTTVGAALTDMLDPDGQFVRQLDRLGEGMAGTHGVFGLPVVGAWLSRTCCRAFHEGFVVPLASDPASVVLDLVREAGDGRPHPSRSGPAR